MSFWTGLKSLFGFPSEDDSDYIDIEPMEADATAMPASAAPSQLPTAASIPGALQTSAPVAGDPGLVADLFDAVVAVFNEAQPDFVRRCLSTDAQKQYILDSLSTSLRQRLSAAVTSPEAAAPAPDTAELERLRSDNGKLRLSLERQKRSMVDRIHNLESNIAGMEVAHSRETDALKARIAEISRNPHDAAPAEPTQELRELEERLAALQAELTRQSTLREQAELKSRMADQMVTDMRNMTARSRAELEEAREAAAKEQDSLKARIAELEASLEEELRQDYRTRLDRMAEENAGLKKTIETNLYNQANNEMRLRKEIKELKSRLGSDTLPLEDPAATSAAPSRKRGRPKKAQIDPSLADPEWFATSGEAPADMSRAAKGEHKSDPDFGYHEPPRRSPNDNAAQLSLF